MSRANKRTRPDIQGATRKADELISKLGIKQPPVPVEDILTACGISVEYHNLEPSVSGVLVRRGDTASVGVNALHHRNRQRFTLAHELGHFYLHLDSPTVFVDDALVHFRGDDVTVPDDPQEMEANAFAGALLMPERMLRADLAGRYIDAFDDSAVRDLARKYAVSAQALTIRLTRVGLIGGIGDLVKRLS